MEIGQNEKTEKKKEIDVFGVNVERYYARAEKTYKVRRVKLDTNHGSIVWKPHKEKKSFKNVGGKKLPVVDKAMISVNDLPQIVLDISNAAVEEGICKIKAHYRVWKRATGDYRWMTQDDVETIEILPMSEKVQ